MRAPPGRKTALAGDRGGLNIDHCAAKSDEPNSSLVGPFHQGNSVPISVGEACRLSGETPATIINWCVRHGIGGHVKTGRGGQWMVDTNGLLRLLSEQEAAS